MKDGGNAGLATAYAARELRVPATIIVPQSATESTIKRLEQYGANVEIFGKVWDDANERAMALAKTDGWINIHPFDHPLVCVAKCLGAKTVAQRALDCTKECPIISHVLEDVEAVEAVEQFLDDERILVEPACGASLALLYSGYLQQLQKEGRLSQALESIVLIVCGGSGISLRGLQAMKKQLGMK
ncbi:L-serine dehydratase/L-threonine deaminase [Crotalus adamanteus]|uniref:L-serine deaminase n=1 Tax=Crotalus adamanteus TaxID=8729 RepID=A0AAW1APD1_CROAD